MKYNYAPIAVSFIGIMIAFKIHRDIALEFRTVDGKTQEFFGLLIWAKYRYMYYFSAIGTIALGLSIKAIAKKEDLQTTALSILLAVISVVVYYVDIWKYLAKQSS